MGVSIIGVGFQSPSSMKNWAEKEEFQYEVWTDSDKTLAAYYDDTFSEGQAFPNRVTVLLSAEGELLLEYPTSMTGDIGTHPSQVLADCEKLFSN